MLICNYLQMNVLQKSFTERMRRFANIFGECGIERLAIGKAHHGTNLLDSVATQTSVSQKSHRILDAILIDQR